MTTCPKCGYVRQAADTAPDYECPKCGIVYSKYQPRPQIAKVAEQETAQIVGAEPSMSFRERSDKWLAKNTKFTTLVFLGVVVVPILYLFAYGERTPKQVPPMAAVTPTDHSSSAFTRCQRYVRDRLKAPATADFPFLDRKTWKFDDDVYVVKSYVDAQNSFGAMLRTNWHCKVQYVGGDWKLLELELINP
jgi:hypothetical protein